MCPSCRKAFRILSANVRQARTLEESASAQIDKAIVGGTFFIYGEKIEIKYGDAKNKLDEALKQLIESVYSKLNLVNTFYDSDAIVLTILNVNRIKAVLPEWAAIMNLP